MRYIRLAFLVAGTLLAALLGSPAQAVTPQLSFGPAANVATGDGPASVAAGDFNGDGNPDLAVANQLSNTVSVLIGSAGGGFTRQTPDLAVGGFPTSVAVSDVNGDQDPDLAVANGSGTLSVLLGGNGATFTRQTPDLTIGGAPWSVAVGDFNRDGNPDLAVANQLTNKVSILLGSVGGSFIRQSPDLTVGSAPTSVAVGDFNGDQNPDLAVANQFDGTVSVLLGTGGAGFSAATTAGNYTLGSDFMSVAVGDFNGDGDPDLAVGDMSPGEVLVFLGGTGGSFNSPTTLTVHSGVSSVAVGDFNRDGDPDLAVANFNDGRVSVLVGGAGGSFGSLADFTAGSGSPSVAVGDFNCDGKADFAAASFNSDTVAVRLNTTVTNQAPTAAADAYSTTEDIALTVNAPGVLGNDSDPDGNPLSAVLVSGPSHGTLTLNGNGSFTYTPASNFNGSDSFTYRASDGTLTSNPATVAISVTAVNDTPTAADDAYSTAEDTVLTVATPGVLGNDSDPDGNPLSAVLVSGPSHATLTLNGNGSFTYTPAAHYDGSDSFTYRANDGTVDSNQATVTITITATNEEPTAADDAYSTIEDTALTVAAPGVLANDSDPDHDTLSAVRVSGPSHGTLTLNGNGSFTYTPASNFNGSDSFTYRANDGTVDSNQATVTITITATNDRPTADDDAYTTAEDTTVTVNAPGLLGDDSDPDHDPLSAVLGSGPSHGTLTLNGNGSFTYSPDDNFNGSDSFTYRANDGTVDSNQATVTITITATNDRPTADDDAYSTAEDTVLTVNAPGVLANDSDPDGNQLSAVLGSGPSHGTLTLNANGSFSYTPAANFNGSDSFTYRAIDGNQNSDPATVTLTVTARNDTPTVRVDAGGTCGKDDHSGTVNLTVADVDSPAAKLTLSATSSSNSTLVPTSNVNFAGSDASRKMTVNAVDGRSGTAILTITVSDGQDSDMVDGLVTVTVGGGGKDTLTGGNGADLLLAQSNNDTLTGGDGNDLLCGDSGGDTISGGTGDDSLGGGSGSDLLTGGSGADRFSGGSGTDAATDVTAAEGDTIEGTIP
jgi:VCBS repeat-containing protein